MYSGGNQRELASLQLPSHPAIKGRLEQLEFAKSDIEGEIPPKDLQDSNLLQGQAILTIRFLQIMSETSGLAGSVSYRANLMANSSYFVIGSIHDTVEPFS